MGRVGAGANLESDARLAAGDRGSCLFIRYNIGVVETIADHVVVMRAGMIHEQGTCQAVLGRLQGAYTRYLLTVVPRLVFN